MDAVLAVNFILNDSKQACSPKQALEVQLKNKCSYVYTDVVAKEYILNNLIKANLARGDKSEDLFFKIKQYVVTSWLKKHFSINDFFTFFLNYSYYGDNVIGINNAVSRFFNKQLDSNNLTPREAAFLAKRIFDNNSYIYSNNNKAYLITEDNILEAMEELGFLSRSDLDKAKKAKIHVTGGNSNDAYKMYSDSMVSVALTKTDDSNDIKVYSTLNKKIQEGLSLSLYTLVGNYNIPSVASYIVDNGNIVSAFSFDIVNSISKYNNRYPLVKIKYLLRPLFYLGLYNNGIGVPNSLINPNVQDIISDQNISPSSIAKYFPIFASGMGNNIDINNANHQSVLNKIAMQLVNIENQLFSKLNDQDAETLMKNLMLPIDDFERQDKKYSLIASFNSIVNSYAILNQQGRYYVPIFMNQVNEDSLKSSTLTLATFDKTAIEKTLSVIKTEKILDEKYKVIYDNNMAIVYYKNYTAGVWLGDSALDFNKNLSINRVAPLEKAVQAVAQTLVVAIKEANLEEDKKNKLSSNSYTDTDKQKEKVNNVDESLQSKSNSEAKVEENNEKSTETNS